MVSASLAEKRLKKIDEDEEACGAEEELTETDFNYSEERLKLKTNYIQSN